MGIDNPISFLDLPPELRLQTYKILLGRYPYSPIRLGRKETEKNSSEDKQNTTETRRLHPAVPFIFPLMQLFLTNKQVYLEAVHVFYTQHIFRTSIELGEKDWQKIYKWLRMIGPHNRKNLRRIEIDYRCLEWAPILEGGQPGERWVGDLYGMVRYLPIDWEDLSPTGGWVEFISPTIEKIFKLLGECGNVIVTFKSGPGELLDRLLCPELYQAEQGNEYPNSVWFDMSHKNWFRHYISFREQPDIDYDGDLYGEYDFFGPPTKSLLPDLMELYRTRYGVESISVLWRVERFYPFDGFASKGPLTARALSYYFDVLLPHDAKALGLDEVGTGSYGRGLLSWASKHDLILHGLSAFTLCSLECQDPTGNISRAIMFHRNKVLLDLHNRLSQQQVDDVLIQGMALLIPVDDYLGHYEFGPVHLNGMREVVKLRGGFDAVGSSDENAFGRNLRMSMLVTMSLVEFHVQTTITNAPTTLANGVFPHPLPVWGETALDLPPGFRDLARCGYLSDETIGIVRDFSHWLARNKESEPTARQTWRCSMSRNLNNLEKCISVTLACLADDLSAMGTHPAALIFRKPQRRAEVLAAVTEVWNDFLLIECVIWMCTVVATPRNRQIICREKQRQLLRRSILQRYPASNWSDIRQILQRFFYDSSCEHDWEEAWNMALAELPDVENKENSLHGHTSTQRLA
ncbi:uncharacterized protein CDV56_104316 [Aspergillus thermomutatus]|uniref:Uncharacterized protein n=1 Tax=Aspergillus thermomutatus TaxID=41047 RepID=A0A397GNE6_ASPTH|nr:uncharacterized protein CDV56_104316 [Aspergillus thermomutatus]RHZ49500.1 hypothetical protein CDV56_104316 [Aspergillus thermomutatus]